MNIDLSFLPAVNAGLNATAGVLLLVGFALIRQHRVKAHRNVMMAAFGVSALFLVTYVAHYVWRAAVAGGVHTRYNAEGYLLWGYYGMLISHILLAIFVPLFAVALIYLGLTKRYAAHRRLAKVAWPTWMYVSVTGVLIYFMLYHFNPEA
ncbi:DUF420 domain-containing protein [Phycisphaerales bacterium AB-hyl4]|uniref:DUF420 domain-containing protein n=1 Tax=Natronomicrosphaera hydrolytica TaxID=3242702 RepID=A0ABV4U8I2_9BACT